MWADVMNNTNQGKVFRDFRGEMMNSGIDYGNSIEKKILVTGFHERHQKRIVIYELLQKAITQ